MYESIEKKITEFLIETEPLFNRLIDLSLETAVELYELLDIAANSANLNIKTINPEIRAVLCSRQDEVLERIIDEDCFQGKVIQKPQAVYTPAVQAYRRWTNTELLKDKCLTGYMLARTLGANPVMYFGTKIDDYTYLNTLPGLEILYDSAPSGAANIYYDHLKSDFHNMDVLILHGMYEQTIDFLDAYRILRPEGKVYCGLDMNSHWMSRIEWEHPKTQKFAEQCDIVATSCTYLRDKLNQNARVNFPCRWLSNAFYNANNTKFNADARKKKNIILTVGRIGTAQKNNSELLIAFAKVSSILQGWSLRLVGPIEPDFQHQINQYFVKRPDLKERVVFTGAIIDKERLYGEYASAKIFALTSQMEGGTPNVYAEALYHGCKFVTSDIDAADDIIGAGTLGIKYKLGDIDGLCSALIALSRKSSRAEYQKHIPFALEYGRKYFDWNRNAKKLAYMLYKS